MKLNRYLLPLAAVLFAAVSLTGCKAGISADAKNTDIQEQTVNYHSSLGDGLTLWATASARDDVVAVVFTCETDKSVYALAQTSAVLNDQTAGVQNSYLQKKTGGEKIPALNLTDDEKYGSSSTAYFSIPYNTLSDYNLFFSCNLLLSLDDKNPITVPLDSNEYVFNQQVLTFPFDQSIQLDRVTITKKDNQKYANIAYTLSSDQLFFELNVNKSEVNTGSAYGNISETGNKTYMYCHPITDTEKEIEISFDGINFHHLFEGKIEL